MLQILNDYKIKLAIATYKRDSYAKKIIHEFMFDKYCYPCLGSDSTTLIAKSDIIRACMIKMDADKQQSLYIGDTEHDKIGALEAGIGFLAVTYGYGYSNFDHPDNYAETPLDIVKNIVKD